MTQFEAPSLVIGADIMDEANDAVSRLLKPSPTARVTGKGTFWTEQFDCTGADYGVVPENPNRLRIALKFRVANESVDTTNVGRQFTASYLINPSSFADKGSKERMMSMMALGRLGNFLRATGIIGQEESAAGKDLKEFFLGENAPVVGAKVYAVIKGYKDKDGVPRQDVTQYDSLDAGASA